MLHWINHVPGVLFPVAFWAIAFFSLFLGLHLIAKNTPQRAELSKEPLGPEEMAYLRDGWKAVLQTVLFRLWTLGLIAITSERMLLVTSSQELEKTSPVLSELDSIVLNTLETPGSYHTLTSNKAFIARFQRTLALVTSKLQANGFIKTADQQKNERYIALLAISLPLVLGVILLLIMRATQHSSEGQSVLRYSLVVAFCLLTAWLYPRNGMSKVAKLFFQGMQLKFAWMTEPNRSEHNQEVEPAMGLALYGHDYLISLDSYYEAFGPILPLNLRPARIVKEGVVHYVGAGYLDEDFG